LVATSSTAFRWEIDNAKEFQSALNRLGAQTHDLRIPFRLIASDWYRSNKRLFTLKSAGLYQDLAPARGIEGNPSTTSNYKRVKELRQGSAYPILVGESKDLSRSILSKSAAFSIFNLAYNLLEMGSSVPYGPYHQSDEPRSKIPQRKFIFIDGGPADKSQDSSINGRRERWLNIINDHIKQLVTGEIVK